MLHVLLLEEKGRFSSSIQANQTIHHIVRFCCRQHSSTPSFNTVSVLEYGTESVFLCQKGDSSGSKCERVSLPPQLCTGQHFPVHSTQNYYVRIGTKVGSSGSFKTKAALPKPSVANRAECKIQSKREQRNDK